MHECLALVERIYVGGSSLWLRGAATAEPRTISFVRSVVVIDGRAWRPSMRFINRRLATRPMS